MTLRLSIITPSYDADRFIDDCLDSVFSQSAPALHPHHPVVTAQENQGLAATLNRLVAMTTGGWIGWLNADDFNLQDAFAHLAAALADTPDVGLVIGDTLFVDEAGRTSRLLPDHRLSGLIIHHYGMSAAPSSFFVRGDLLRRVGFRPNTKLLMDKWLFAGQVSAKARDASGDDERRAFRSEQGLPDAGWKLNASRSYGRALHIAEKVRTGGYLRQLRTRSDRGNDARWWLSPSTNNDKPSLNDRH
jgi:hypothetical protein